MEDNAVIDLSQGSAQHIGAREHQEDAFGFSTLQNRSFTSYSENLAVVADGMGGRELGSEVSQIAVHHFVAAYQQKSANESIRDVLHRAAHAANRAVLEFANSQGEGVKTGTTLSATLVCAGKIYWISIGDSRIYRLTSESARQLSVDHNFGQLLDQMVNRNEISTAEAMRDPQRNALVSFLGGTKIESIGYGEEQVLLAPGEVVMLCTDGLCRAIPDDEITQNFSSDPQLLCENLTTLAVEKYLPDQDNITVIALGRGGSSIGGAVGLGSSKFANIDPRVLFWIFVALLAICIAIFLILR